MNFIKSKINGVTKGYTPLHNAVISGDLSKVRIAVQTEQTDIIDKEGNTALHLAAEKGLEFIVAELLDRQATATVFNQAGFTPVHLAADKGYTTVVQHLLGSRNRRDAPETKKKLANSFSPAGKTPLMMATLGGHLKMAQDLIRTYGADPNLADGSGCTPFMSAVQRGDVGTLDSLFTLGATIEGPRFQGWTPLHAAASTGQEAAVLWLVEHGANLNAKDNSALTPMDLALANGHNSLCRLLRETTNRKNVSQGADASSFSQGGGLSTSSGGAPSSFTVVTERSMNSGPRPSQQSLSQMLEQKASQVPSPSAYPDLPAGATRYF